jgi:hypothetical protein
VQLGQYVLIFQESKGPLRAFAAEVIHVEENTIKIAIFHPLEDFRIITATIEGRKLTGPRDTTMELRDPNAKEKITIAKMRDTVLARLTEAERRAYETPADDGKKRKKKEVTPVAKPVKVAAATAPPKKKAPAKKAAAKRVPKKKTKKT